MLDHPTHPSSYRAGAPLTAALASEIRALVAAADHVLIAAGAGMSVDAGFDYNDPVSFAQRYPRVAASGARCRYHMFGYPWPSEAAQWGHLARHLEELRYLPPPRPEPYEQLRALTAHADRFVLTSNADDLFERSGFDPQRVWTRQGSYSRLQCLTPCTDASTWDAEAWVKAAAPRVDLATEELSDAALIPRCPRCGGQAMMNVRGGDWFLESPYEPQAARFDAWLSQATGRLAVLDVGTGFNTPSVIRWPAEAIVRRSPRATLVRVNPARPEVPVDLGSRAIGVACAGAQLWPMLGATAPVQ